MSLPCIIYAAKSTEDKHGSIPTQLEDCRQMAEREGWDVTAEFSDEGFSAYKGNRGPGLARAREDAAARAPSVIVVQHSDRLARGAGDAPGAAEHLAEIVFWANRHNVQLRSCQDDATFTSPALAPVMAALMGMRNMEDSRRKSLAVKDGITRAAQQGRTHGGQRPYGYIYEDGQLITVPHEAEIVRRIFEEFVAGRSITAITRGLQRDRITTVRGKVWHQVTVSGMLRNRRYIGEVEHRGEAYQGQHDAIISRDLFDQAQQLRAARPSKGRGRPTKGQHLFRRGLLRCGSCGGAMVPRTSHGREVYYCDGHSKLGNEHCPMLDVPREDVDSAVYAYFEKVGLDVEATRKQVAGARDKQLAQVRALIKDATRAEREASEALTRVKRDYTRGALGIEDWNELRPELTEERDGAKAALAQLADQEREIESWAEVRDTEAETLRRLAEIRLAVAGEVKDASGIESVRAALLRLFERFVVHVDLETSQGRIEAVVRPDAIRTVEGEAMTPVLHPTALEIAEGNQRVGSATR